MFLPSRRHKTPTQHAKALGYTSLAAILAACIASTSVIADEYYRWQDTEGVVHYGSQPPKGVEAQKVKTYGGKSVSTPATTSLAEDEQAPVEADEDLPPQEVERRRKVAAKQKEACDQEQQRLATLNRPGRIRMKQADGSLRYMTQEEIQKEIGISQKVISDSCK